jgi:hypothetical protein
MSRNETDKTVAIFLYLKLLYLNKVLQKCSTAQPSSSVAKHKLLTDTKKQQDVITSNRAIMTSLKITKNDPEHYF